MVKISEVYIVPWALPNEEIPLHVAWSEAEEFDEVRIRVPKDLNVVDVLNVDEVKVEEDVVTLKPRRALVNAPNFFGMILTSPKIYDELKIAKTISIEFLRQNEIVDRRELYARIFRPYLEVVKAPGTIELLDKEKTRTLPLHIKYAGFGDIQIKFEATIGGRIVSHGESIIYELLRRLWFSGLFEEKEEEELKIRKRELRIAPYYVKEMAEALKKTIETGIIPIEEIDEEAVEGVKRWLSDVRTQEKFSKLLYSRVEDILLGLLVDLFDRHPTDNVKLSDAQTRIRTKIQAPIENLTLHLKYRDPVGNEYRSVDIAIRIVDKRVTENRFAIDTPIVIERWEDEPFMNVKDMEINGE